MQTIYEKINANEQIKEIIKNEIIEVEIEFKYSQKEKYIQLSTIQRNEDNDEDKDTNNSSNINNNSKTCYNISEFIRNFPDLNEIQKCYDISIFKIEKEIKVKEFLNSYLYLIKATILSKYKEENKQKMILIIKKYIFEKIYNKIFPNYIEEKDINILAKALNLNKIKPEYLNLYNFDYDSLIPVIQNIYNQIEERRYPNDKLDLINQIFEIIFNILNYVKGDEYSDDDLFFSSQPLIECSNLFFLFLC